MHTIVKFTWLVFYNSHHANLSVYGGLHQKSWECQDSSENALHTRLGPSSESRVRAGRLLMQTSVCYYHIGGGCLQTNLQFEVL